jgi:hypothetical protein
MSSSHAETFQSGDKMANHTLVTSPDSPNG